MSQGSARPATLTPPKAVKKMSVRQQLTREIIAATTFRSGISARELFSKAWTSMAAVLGPNGHGSDPKKPVKKL
jgi:hypothetical protein